MWNQIFNPENFFFRWCNKIVDVVGLSILWLFCSLPVVTLGPATAALYYSVVKCLRRGEEKPYLSFFQSFRANFKVGVLATLLCVPVALFANWDYTHLVAVANTGDKTALLLFAAFCVLCLPLLGTGLYLFPVLSRFSLNVGGLFAMAAKLAIRHLPSTIVVVLLAVQMIAACMRYWFPSLFLPALGALLISLFLERIFKKYTPAVPTSAETEEAAPPWYLK